MPWQKVHKVSIAIETASIAYDPEDPTVNKNWTVLEAVSKDQLNIGVTGQLRFKVSERNLYAYLFGVKHPVAHIMGYFVSILRERIANFQAKHEAEGVSLDQIDDAIMEGGTPQIEGVSINDLRKNLNELNEQMNTECLSSAARYGIELDASLITGIDPPSDIDSALAAINTAHNEVSADISLAERRARCCSGHGRAGAVERGSLEVLRLRLGAHPVEALSVARVLAFFATLVALRDLRANFIYSIPTKMVYVNCNYEV
jgi:hypothetical protein